LSEPITGISSYPGDFLSFFAVTLFTSPASRPAAGAYRIPLSHSLAFRYSQWEMAHAGKG